LFSNIVYGQNIDDGTYDAEVSYHNPSTGYSSTYELEVEVEDGYLTVIYFPSGGWLDDSHITPAEINGDYVYVYDDRGREYEVYIYQQNDLKHQTSNFINQKSNTMKHILLILGLGLSISAFAHSGGTDSQGGHHDRKRGGYHFHHGYGPHSHLNGKCPYKNKSVVATHHDDTKKEKDIPWGAIALAGTALYGIRSRNKAA